MKDYIEQRVVDIANYVLDNKCTVRQVARVFCVSKSTAHKDLHERLFVLDKNLYDKVAQILGKNWAERYIRGGESTKRKYQQN